MMATFTLTTLAAGAALVLLFFAWVALVDSWHEASPLFLAAAVALILTGWGLSDLRVWS